MPCTGVRATRALGNFDIPAPTPPMGRAKKILRTDSWTRKPKNWEGSLMPMVGCGAQADMVPGFSHPGGHGVREGIVYRRLGKKWRW